MNHPKIYLTIKVLALIGILLAVYLLVEQIFRPPFAPCNINSVVNCNAVISGPLAYTFGIPTPLFGLAGYLIIFLAAVVFNKKLIFGVAAFGLAFCLWIAFRELVQLHVVCPVCISCQLDMIMVFGLSIFLNKKTSSKEQSKS